MIKYTHPKHLQFIQDMEFLKPGHTELEVKHHNVVRGKGQRRYCWQGPSVSVSCLRDALRRTEVPCQWDELGSVYIVYPLQGMQSGGA